jgi:hypothetical protein
MFRVCGQIPFVRNAGVHRLTLLRMQYIGFGEPAQTQRRYDSVCGQNVVPRVRTSGTGNEPELSIVRVCTCGLP